MVGGYHPSGYTQIIKDKNIDFAVIGEGEQAFLQLLRNIRDNEEITNVKGITYWDKELKVTEPRDRVQNLDILSWSSRNKEICLSIKEELRLPIQPVVSTIALMLWLTRFGVVR